MRSAAAELELGDSPKKKRRTRHELKELIIEAASELFAQKGYSEPTIREIADAAQVVLPTLYRIFDDKRDIYDQCCKRAAAKYLGGFRESLREEPSGEHIVYRILSDAVMMSLGKGVDYTLLARAALDGRSLLNRDMLSSNDRGVFRKYLEVFERGSGGDYPELRVMMFERIISQLPTAFALGSYADLRDDCHTIACKTLEILLPAIDWPAVSSEYRRTHPIPEVAPAANDDRARRSN